MGWRCVICEGVLEHEPSACPECASEGPFERLEQAVPELGAGLVAPLGAHALELRAVAAPLFAPLGGKVPKAGAVVLVAGPPSAGKSTECARAAKELGGVVLWADREQGGDYLAQTLDVAGWSASEITGRLRVTRTAEWSELARAVAVAGASVLVVDSVQTWAEGDGERIAMLRALKKLSEEKRVVVLAIARTAKTGEVRGEMGIQNEGDATVLVTPTTIESRKSRWPPRPPVVVLRESSAPAAPALGPGPSEEPRADEKKRRSSSALH